MVMALWVIAGVALAAGVVVLMWPSKSPDVPNSEERSGAGRALDGVVVRPLELPSSGVAGQSTDVAVCDVVEGEIVASDEVRDAQVPLSDGRLQLGSGYSRDALDAAPLQVYDPDRPEAAGWREHDFGAAGRGSVPVPDCAAVQDVSEAVDGPVVDAVETADDAVPRSAATEPVDVHDDFDVASVDDAPVVNDGFVLPAQVVAPQGGDALGGVTRTGFWRRLFSGGARTSGRGVSVSVSSDVVVERNTVAVGDSDGVEAGQLMGGSAGNVSELDDVQVGRRGFDQPSLPVSRVDGNPAAPSTVQVVPASDDAAPAPSSPAPEQTPAHLVPPPAAPQSVPETDTEPATAPPVADVAPVEEQAATFVDVTPPPPPPPVVQAVAADDEPVPAPSFPAPQSVPETGTEPVTPPVADVGAAPAPSSPAPEQTPAHLVPPLAAPQSVPETDTEPATAPPVADVAPVEEQAATFVDVAPPPPVVQVVAADDEAVPAPSFPAPQSVPETGTESATAPPVADIPEAIDHTPAAAHWAFADTAHLGDTDPQDAAAPPTDTAADKAAADEQRKSDLRAAIGEERARQERAKEDKRKAIAEAKAAKAKARAEHRAAAAEAKAAKAEQRRAQLESRLRSVGDTTSRAARRLSAQLEREANKANAESMKAMTARRDAQESVRQVEQAERARRSSETQKHAAATMKSHKTQRALFAAAAQAAKIGRAKPAPETPRDTDDLAALLAAPSGIAQPQPAEPVTSPQADNAPSTTYDADTDEQTQAPRPTPDIDFVLHPASMGSHIPIDMATFGLPEQLPPQRPKTKPSA